MEYATLTTGPKKKFKSGMMREVDESKPPYELVDFPMITRWAFLMGRGAKKYSKNNWKKANTQEELDRFKASALRHMIQYFEGQTDEDHAAAVFFNISGAEYVADRLKNERTGKQRKNTKTDKPVGFNK